MRAGELHCRYCSRRMKCRPVLIRISSERWGFCAGIRAYAHLRGRASNDAGSDLWPQADDPWMFGRIRDHRGRLLGARAVNGELPALAY